MFSIILLLTCKLLSRYFLVEKAKDANIVGILVGTLGVGKSSHQLESNFQH